MIARRILVAFLLVTLLHCGGSAPPQEASPDQLQQAQEALQRGQEAFRRAAFDEAGLSTDGIVTAGSTTQKVVSSPW